MPLECSEGDDDEPVPQLLAAKQEPDGLEASFVTRDQERNSMPTATIGTRLAANSTSRPAVPRPGVPEIPAAFSKVTQLASVETSSPTTAREVGPAAAPRDVDHDKGASQEAT